MPNIDKRGVVTGGDRYSGVVYVKPDGSRDEARSYTRWEEWVEREAKHLTSRKDVDETIDILIRQTGKFVREKIAEACTPLVQRIEQLEQTLGEFGYLGQWQEGVVYRAGNFVTLGGSLWHCNVNECSTRPSTENPDYSLAVKRGRDGKPGELRQPTNHSHVRAY